MSCNTINEQIPEFNFEVFADKAWTKTVELKNPTGVIYTVPTAASMVITDSTDTVLKTITGTLAQVGLLAHITFAMTAAEMVAMALLSTETELCYKATKTESAAATPLCYGVVTII